MRTYICQNLVYDQEDVVIADGPSQAARAFAHDNVDDAERVRVRDATSGEAWDFDCAIGRCVVDVSVRWVRPEGER